MALRERFHLSRSVKEHLVIGGFFATLAIISLADPAVATGGAGVGVGGGPPAAPAGPDVCTGDACGQSIIDLGNGLLRYALITAVAGIIISSILWALGSKGQNPGTELAGKRGMIVCCTAAFLVGALPGWLDWLQDLAGEIRAEN